MKTYELSLRDDGPGVHKVERYRFRAPTLAEAMTQIPPRKVVLFWAVIPSAKDIRKTKNLLRNL